MTIYNFIHYSYRYIRKISSNLKYKYIKFRYRFTINDLKIYNNENYNEKGTYITVRNTRPKDYKKRRRNQIFDKDGILLYKYNNELRYNIIQIIQYGLEEYGYYIDNGNKEHLLNSKKVGEWIVNKLNKETGAWEIEFDYLNKNIDYELKGPWCSAISQGQGISLLCRLYQVYKYDNYEEVVKLAMKPFRILVEDGGILRNLNGLSIYEEYPTYPGSFTLNGFIYSLFGLYDAYMTFNLKEAKELFDIGINTLIKILPLYDDSRLSYYDLSHIMSPNRKPTQNSKYHVIHIKLLQGLMSIYPNKAFEFYIKRWKTIL